MKSKLTMGITPKSSLSLSTTAKWVRSKMNEQSGTNTTVYGYDSAGAFSDVEAVAGTTTALWNTTVGALDCNGDNGTIATHDMGDICRLDNLDGTIMFHFKYGGNTNGTTGTDYAFAYRNPFSTQGWGLRITTLIRPSFAITEGSSTTITGGVGTELTDVANELEGITGIIYRSGGAGDLTFGMYGKGNLIGALNTTAYAPDETIGNFTLSGRASDAGFVNAESTLGVLFGDIIVVRTPLDLRDDAVRIANEWDNNQWEENRILSELGV